MNGPVRICEYMPEDETFEDPPPPTPVMYPMDVRNRTTVPVLAEQLYRMAQVLTNNDTINFREASVIDPIKCMEALIELAKEKMEKLDEFENYNT